MTHREFIELARDAGKSLGLHSHDRRLLGMMDRHRDEFLIWADRAGRENGCIALYMKDTETRALAFGSFSSGRIKRSPLIRPRAAMPVKERRLLEKWDREAPGAKARQKAAAEKYWKSEKGIAAKARAATPEAIEKRRAYQNDRYWKERDAERKDVEGRCNRPSAWPEGLITMGEIGGKPAVWKSTF